MSKLNALPIPPLVTPASDFYASQAIPVRPRVYAFHDYKTAGIERAKLEGWAKKAGWETLLNRAGTTFKKLPDKDKDGVTEQKAIALMLAQPSMIKRPVLDLGGGKLLVGFKPEIYAASVPAQR